MLDVIFVVKFIKKFESVLNCEISTNFKLNILNAL
jgi:hypothetical protein